MFRCQEVEDIGALLPEVQEAVLDFSRFASMVSLEAFGPFKTGANALENINCISEGEDMWGAVMGGGGGGSLVCVRGCVDVPQK